jgi:hypothetical protein
MEKRFFERIYDSINYSVNYLYVNNDNNTMINNKQTAVEWFIERLTKNPLPQTKDEFIDGDLVDITNKAKEMDKQQKIEFAEWYKDIVNSTAYQDKDCQRLFQKTTSELYEEFIKTYGGNK